MTEQFETTLSNYYGTVGFRKREDNYTMFLDNWNDENSVPISKELYEEAKRLFVKE